MRDAPPEISGPVLRGYVGALAPAAHIELLLLRRTVQVALDPTTNIDPSTLDPQL
jgi:hypothetical protein